MARAVIDQENSAQKIAAEVSVIVPTYKEAEALPDLLKRLEPLRTQFDRFEVLIVDDNSQDGTEDVLRKLDLADWVQLVVRTKDRGLSASVIDGCKLAKFSTIVVMDADLSHPPEKIPEMVNTLYDSDTEFVIGSRYVKGGHIDQDWGLFRQINSTFATLLARPFTKAKDPMSGFFALRRNDFLKAAPLNPIGYKIGLELIVKCGFSEVKEVPIEFQDRQKGESKLSWKEQVKYLRHIKRLTDYKYGNFSFFFQFGIVGVSGFIVNQIAVTIADVFLSSIHAIFIIGIFAGMICTFTFNRYFTFNHGSHEKWPQQFGKFVAACSLGAIANYSTSVAFVKAFPEYYSTPQVPVAVGAIAGIAFNFILSRYVVFKKNLILSKPE